MSDTQSGPAATAGRHAAPYASGEQYAAQQRSYAEPERGSVWFGRGLAGFLLILNGLYGFLIGLAAIIKGGFFAVHGAYYYEWSISSWGWVQLALGIVLFAVGVSILLGMLWARILGAVLAGFSAIASFLFIPHYPIWSIIVIAVDVFIIWALMSSGRREPSYR